VSGIENEHNLDKSQSREQDIDTQSRDVLHRVQSVFRKVSTVPAGIGSEIEKAYQEALSVYVSDRDAWDLALDRYFDLLASDFGMIASPSPDVDVEAVSDAVESGDTEEMEVLLENVPMVQAVLLTRAIRRCRANFIECIARESDINKCRLQRRACERGALTYVSSPRLQGTIVELRRGEKVTLKRAGTKPEH
jgi:hypothetical protein